LVYFYCTRQLRSLLDEDSARSFEMEGAVLSCSRALDAELARPRGAVRLPTVIERARLRSTAITKVVLANNRLEAAGDVVTLSGLN